MKRIELECFGIVIEDDMPSHVSISSDLKKDVYISDEFDLTDMLEIISAMDMIESLVLAHHCAGIDVTSPAYITGIETSVEAFWNNV